VNETRDHLPAPRTNHLHPIDNHEFMLRLMMMTFIAIAIDDLFSVLDEW
jgi:hypothetical protein